MLKGYDDCCGGRVKITHWPLRSLLRCKTSPRELNNNRKDLNWGKTNTGFGAVRIPYSLYAENGWSPFLWKRKNSL